MMLLPRGLTRAELPEWREGLRIGCPQAYRVTMLDLAYDTIADVTARTIDAQVNWRREGGVDRYAQIGLLDPDFLTGIDTVRSSDGMIARDRMIRIQVAHFIDALDRWVPQVVFTGIPVVPGRDSDVLTLEAHDTARLLLGSPPAVTLKKGKQVVAELRRYLTAFGLRYLRFPPAGAVKAVLPRDFTVGGKNPDNAPWTVLRKIAALAGLQLYVDAYGWIVLRPRPSGAPVVTWGGSQLLAGVQRSTDQTEIFNRVVATGAKEKKLKPAVATAPPAHQLSPQSLAVGDPAVPFISALHVETGITTQKALNEYAEAELKRQLTQHIEIRTEVVPDYSIEPGDRVGILTDDGIVETIAYNEGTLPISADADSTETPSMTVGFTRAIRSPRAGRLPKRLVNARGRLVEVAA